ncbi:hypothetical protein [Mycobacteroides abscessus]|uniref:hypothetical protein n=1 Tax=Mycobacteroides abscessus TaxID=36809 RepID=UPI000E6852A4|nr:hypothetical protein [Mycobacteroides abscessus]RIS87420.1 hypothetical protein D2E44_02600 [Mycobacteroides abscessus]
MAMTEPQRFRKRPVEVEAVQWDGTNDAEIRAWGADFWPIEPEDRTDDPDRTGQLGTYSSWVGVPDGTWIVKDDKGFHPCEPDVFAETYESTHFEAASTYESYDVYVDSGRADELFRAFCNSFGPAVEKSWRGTEDA